MRSRSQSSSGDDRSDGSDRAVLASVFRFLLVVVLVGMFAFGAALMAPPVLEELGMDDQLDRLEEFGVATSPSGDPPPAGERNPNVTDPDDPGNSSYETDVETVESWMVEDFVHAEVNDRRADHELDALEWDGTVASVARAHSHDMADRDYFAHENPDGEEPMDRFQDVDDYCQGYGENIALNAVGGQYQTAEGISTALVDQWMNSTEHREAILEEGDIPDWDRGGVGVYVTDDGEVYASHNFCMVGNPSPI